MLEVYLLMSILLSGLSCLFLIISVMLYTGDDEDWQVIKFLSLMTVAAWAWPVLIIALPTLFVRKIYLILTNKI